MGKPSDERHRHGIRRAQGRKRHQQNVTDSAPRPTRSERRLKHAEVARSSHILEQFDKNSIARKIALRFIEAYTSIGYCSDEYAEAELIMRRQLPRHMSANERIIKCGIWAARKAIDAARATLEE